VSAQRNILDVLETYVSNNKLVIKYRNNVNVRSHLPVTITLSAPDISSIFLSGSGNLETTGSFTPANLDLAVSGSGNIHMQQVHTGNIEAFVSGSGSIHANNGTTIEQKITISGSGNIDLSNVSAKKVSTITSGSGNIKLYATDWLNVKISGSGNVYYRGNPSINTSISGSGSVIRF
jgi:hypothetical protein